ncbi:MAG: FxsA family protein [Planctomycetota bacterium]|jgi:UPF0716 protein FxsA
MLLKLLFLFTFVPLLELVLLLQVGRWIGVWPTVGIVLATGFVGAFLARWAGASVLRRIREEVNRGRVPSDGLIEGALVLAGGAMLLTPGILTDLLGLALLIPPTRVFLRDRLKRTAKRRAKHFSADFRVIDVEPTSARDVNRDA